MKLFFSLLFLLLFSSCIKKNETPKRINLIGNWTFLSKSMSDYAELYVDSSHIKFFSENDGNIGPFPYTIKNDTLFYANWFFCIKNGSSCENHQLVNKDSSYFIYKLILPELKDSTFYYNKIDPFYFRRCFYLFSFGKINLIDVIKYLSELNNSDSTIKFDTILISESKSKI